MWTDRHRTRHEAHLKDMVLQTGLDEVTCFLERADPPGSPNARPVRLVLAAIAWHLRVGGAWRALPAGFPPWRTVYGWFRRWIESSIRKTRYQAHDGIHSAAALPDETAIEAVIQVEINRGEAQYFTASTSSGGFDGSKSWNVEAWSRSWLI